MPNRLTVIQGTKKGKINYRDIYIRIFLDKMDEFIGNNNQPTDLTYQLIYYGVKYIDCCEKNIDVHELESVFSLVQLLKTIIATITPRELIKIFPIDKNYDGDKYQVKDYFYSVKLIEKVGIDTQIGNNVDHFLCDYNNRYIRSFCVKEMCLISIMRRAKGEKGLFESFLDSQGTHLTSYSKSIDLKGKEIFINNDTGEVTKIKKRRPRYIKII